MTDLSAIARRNWTRNSIAINVTIDFSRTFLHLCVGRLEVTLSTRAWADDALACWDAGSVAYHRDGAGETSLRVPFGAAFRGRA